MESEDEDEMLSGGAWLKVLLLLLLLLSDQSRVSCRLKRWIATSASRARTRGKDKLERFDCCSWWPCRSSGRCWFSSSCSYGSEEISRLPMVRGSWTTRCARKKHKNLVLLKHFHGSKKCFLYYPNSSRRSGNDSRSGSRCREAG